tara:strand:- start:743 stop:1180 length:438 start_codon:yes stop_codon:yes gene_type:complete
LDIYLTAHRYFCATLHGWLLNLYNTRLFPAEALPMSRYPHKNLPLVKPKFEKKPFETKKPPRLGSKRSPLKLLVNTEEKQAEVKALCKEHGLFCDIDLSADNEEDISQLTLILDKKVVAKTTRLAGRNDPCPCGSGKKYKQCCAA